MESAPPPSIDARETDAGPSCRAIGDLSGYASLIGRWLDALEQRLPGEPGRGAKI